MGRVAGSNGEELATQPMKHLQVAGNGTVMEEVVRCVANIAAATASTLSWHDGRVNKGCNKEASGVQCAAARWRTEISKGDEAAIHPIEDTQTEEDGVVKEEVVRYRPVMAALGNRLQKCGLDGEGGPKPLEVLTAKVATAANSTP